MDSKQFREFGKAAVDYIADYIETVEHRPVVAPVSPGYLSEFLPESAPQQGEQWQDVLQDFDRIIMPGITHWMSPNFHAYYPSGCSFPAIVGEMFSAGFGCVGLSWIASPAYTELEVVMMNWLGQMLGLPEVFLNSSDGPGGGVIQSSASEATFVALLTAKEKTVKDMRVLDPKQTEAEVKGKLIAYSSDQANSSVEKSGLLGSMTMRLLKTDEQGRLRGDALENAIREDRDQGLIPCFVVANWGTTPTCAFDRVDELGPICQRENIWLHVDAAYAGTAFVCPEYRYLMEGIDFVDSFNFNPHKWMLVNFDCSALWLRNAQYVVEAFNVDRIYLKDQHQGLAPDYRHWQISLGRRFRALKLWFVLRIYGIEGIQKHVRGQIYLAKYFEELVKSDKRLELFSSSMGLVCLTLKGDDELTVKFLDLVEKRKKILLVTGHFGSRHLIRFAICSRLTEKRHVDYAWQEFQEIMNQMFEKKVLEKVEKASLPSIEIPNTRCQKINAT